MSTLPDHLYDTRIDNWHLKPALRPNYAVHYRKINSTKRLLACLRAGAYAWQDCQNYIESNQK